MITAEQITANVARVHERIERAGGDPAAITLVAVTKAFDPEIARLALAAGLTDLGENYAQELLAKVHDLEAVPPTEGAAPVWHFLGRLQTNKVRHLAGCVDLWQSVDRADLAREIAKRAPGAAVLLQVNLSGEEQKGGCSFDDLDALVTASVGYGLEVRGLMGVGPAGDADGTRSGFERLVGRADELGLPVRSIGMSGDLEAAVAAGATMIRIGRDLFGDRPPR